MMFSYSVPGDCSGCCHFSKHLALSQWPQDNWYLLGLLGTNVRRRQLGRWLRVAMQVYQIRSSISSQCTVVADATHSIIRSTLVALRPEFYTENSTHSACLRV